jgi:putative membrane protein
MAQDWGSIAGLLAGTVLLRPYVFAFLLAFLVVAGRDLGGRRATVWLCWGWAVAFVAEYSSTRSGIPFGLYHYTGYTADRELFISNVPLFDPLSFPFLAYTAWCFARVALGPGRRWASALLGGALMMLADVVIDPMAVVGEKWFLGNVFYYVEPGFYFGVPMSNFVGWVVVGWVIVGGWLWMAGRSPRLGSPRAGTALYYGIVVFNLGITAWTGEGKLLGIGILLHVAVIMVLYRLNAISAVRGWAVGSRGAAQATVTTVTDEGGS